MENIINIQKLQTPENPDVNSWMESGRVIASAFRVIKAAHKNWQGIGVKQWRRPFVRDSWNQLEIELGDARKEKKAEPLNPEGRTGFISIQGICGGFDIWHKRMEKEINTFDCNSLISIKKMISPIIRFNDTLNALIKSKGS